MSFALTQHMLPCACLASAALLPLSHLLCIAFAVNYGLERMNIEVASWMRRDRLTDEEGFATPPFLAMGDGNSVMWNRQLSRESYTNPIDRFHACNMVTQALARIGAKRLVVGHTPQVGPRGYELESSAG
jgi:hypothetical protein